MTGLPWRSSRSLGRPIRRERPAASTIAAVTLAPKEKAPRSHSAGPVQVVPGHFLAAASMARLENTLRRCFLYSSEPWRSACTSTPSGPFSAAAWMDAASAGLPAMAPSTPVARTALVPAPVIPMLALLILPPSMVSTAATPTTAMGELHVRALHVGRRGRDTDFRENLVICERGRKESLEEVVGLDRPLALRPL